MIVVGILTAMQLIHVASGYNTIVAGDNDMADIFCTGNNLIKIVVAGWGTVSTATDVTAVIGGLCNDLRSCKISVSRLTLGDPAPGGTKFLSIGFDCVQEIGMSGFYCEYEDVQLECHNGAALAVNFVYFALPNKYSRFCGSKSGRLCLPGKFPSETIVPMTRRVQNVCNGRPECRFPATADWFRLDPCEFEDKLVEVRWNCL